MFVPETSPLHAIGIWTLLTILTWFAMLLVTEWLPRALREWKRNRAFRAYVKSLPVHRYGKRPRW